MSYVSKYPSKTRVPRGFAGFFEFVDDLFGGGILQNIQGSVEGACKQVGDSERAVADGQIARVESQWHPTGFYTPDQMTKCINFASELMRRAGAALDTAQQDIQLPSHREMLTTARGKTLSESVSAISYVTAINQAKQQGIGVIESQGFRRYVIACLKATRDAREASSFVACARPGWFSVLEGLNSAAEALVDFVVTIGGIAKDVVTTVLQIPDFFSTLVKYGKVLALAGGAYYMAIKTGAIDYDPLNLK